jgi:hypothetical protein
MTVMMNRWISIDWIFEKMVKCRYIWMVQDSSRSLFFKNYTVIKNSCAVSSTLWLVVNLPVKAWDPSIYHLQ